MHTIEKRVAALVGLTLAISCSVGSLLDTPPTKVIGVTPAQVIYSAQKGSAATRDTALVLSTARGGMPPPWTAHRAANAPWLAIATGGGTPDTLRTSLNPSGLTSAVYRDTIVIVP